MRNPGGGSRCRPTVGEVSSAVPLTVLPSLFSASHLQQLAWYGSSDLLRYAQELLQGQSPRPAPATLGELFNDLFDFMRRQYPAEYVYKACLLKRLLFGVYSPRTTACYMEFPVGEARADVLLVNGEATVFEVKSRFDNTMRLEAQLQEYYKCFTKVTVVTEDGHEQAYLDRLPPHIGVATLTRRFSVSRKRIASEHRGALDRASLFRVLRQSERHTIARELGVRVSQVDPAIRYRHVLKRFISELSTLQAHKLVVSALRARQRTERMVARCKLLPRSLHAAAFSYRLPHRDWAALLDALSQIPTTLNRSSHVFPVPTKQASRDAGG